jgi:hypothetical protein
MVGLPGALLDPLWTTILGTATDGAWSSIQVHNIDKKSKDQYHRDHGLINI